MSTPNVPAGPPGSVGTPVDWTSSPQVYTDAVKAVTASQQIMTGAGIITACSYAETTGAARALAYLHDGTDTTGEIRAVLGAASGTGSSLAPNWPGVTFRIGLYLEIASGTMSVAVSWVPTLQQLPG